MIQSNSSFNIMWVSGGRIFRFFPWTFLVIVTTTAQPVMLHIVRTTVYVWALYMRPIQPNCLVEAVLVFRYLLTVSAILLLINVVFNSHFCVGYLKVSCQVTHTIPNLPFPVTGITLLNDRLYFCHGAKPYKPYIAVCCPATFQFQEYIYCACPNCGQCGCCHSTTLNHLVACNFNNCLYVSVSFLNSFFLNCICKVAVDQNKRTYWSVDSALNNLKGLSVTSAHNLLAALNNNSLREYSPEGQQIREISLQPAGITSPVHGVQLPNDQFGVTHHGPKHHFSIVTSDGQLVKSYGGDAGDMNDPRGIAVDERGRIFVADQNINRILVMDSKTLSAYPLPLPTDCPLNGPRCLHYDAANRRLYIGEYNGHTIVCCQL